MSSSRVRRSASWMAGATRPPPRSETATPRWTAADGPEAVVDPEAVERRDLAGGQRRGLEQERGGEQALGGRAAARWPPRASAMRRGQVDGGGHVVVGDLALRAGHERGDRAAHGRRRSACRVAAARAPPRRPRVGGGRLGERGPVDVGGHDRAAGPRAGDVRRGRCPRSAARRRASGDARTWAAGGARWRSGVRWAARPRGGRRRAVGPARRRSLPGERPPPRPGAWGRRGRDGCAGGRRRCGRAACRPGPRCRARRAARSTTPSSNTSTSMVGLVGVDDGDDVAAVHGVARPDPPFEHRARCPCRRRARASGSRPSALYAPSSLAAATMSATWGSAASSRCRA